MRRATRPAPRGGFTLIELLVVISIIAILAALVAAGIGKVRDAQQSKATDQTLLKLQQALATQWKQVADDARDARKEVPEAIRLFCGEDKDRARSLWVYARLRQEFPETFAEATSSFAINGHAFPPKKTFAKVGTTDGPAQHESAALLYLILSEKGGVGGATFAADDVTQGAQGTDGKYRVFLDAWGMPITFKRFASPDEVQQGDYVGPRLAVVQFPPAGSGRDLLDPLGRLSLVDGTKWTDARMNTIRTALGAEIRGRNTLITAVSAGADKDFADAADNQFGYRQTRLGN